MVTGHTWRFGAARRRTPWSVAGYVVMAAMVALLPWATTVAAGHVKTIIQFNAEAGELPEGVAVDSAGHVYVSLTPLGRLVRIAAGSEAAEPFASIEGLQEGDLGLIGLQVDQNDNVYGTVRSANPDANGVWKFDAVTGEAERIPGTEQLPLANALVFDDDGNLFISETTEGAVWRAPADGPAELWVADALLAGDGSAGYPFPIGANGIDINGDTVYVGTTETGLIVSIPIMDDGSAGEPELYAEVGEPVDGIVMDEAGNVYIAGVLTNSVLRVNADGSIDTLATAEDGLDAPASVAFGPDGSLYATNFSVAVGPPGGAGPGIVKIALDETTMAEGENAEAPETMPVTGASPFTAPLSLAAAVALFAAAGAGLRLAMRRSQA